MSVDDLTRNAAQVADRNTVLLGQANVIRSIPKLEPRVTFAQRMHVRRTMVV